MGFDAKLYGVVDNDTTLTANVVHCYHNNDSLHIMIHEHDDSVWEDINDNRTFLRLTREDLIGILGRAKKVLKLISEVEPDIIKKLADLESSFDDLDSLIAEKYFDTDLTKKLTDIVPSTTYVFSSDYPKDKQPRLSYRYIVTVYEIFATLKFILASNKYNAFLYTSY